MLKSKATIFLIYLHIISINIYGQKKSLVNFKTIINEYIEKATILPNKHIFSILPSANQYPLILKDPSALLEQNYTRKLRADFFAIDAIYFNYQYTLKYHFFIETGFKYLNYYTGYKTNNWLVQSGNRGRSTSTFSTYSFDFGAGYRVIVKNNLRLFDIHVGFSAAITDNKVGAGGESFTKESYEDGMGNFGVLEIYSYHIITKRFNLGYYLGLSKDIRVTDNLYLTARYNSSFGRKNIFSEHTFNYSLSTYGIVNEAKGNLTTKGQMYAIGLRWVFN